MLDKARQSSTVLTVLFVVSVLIVSLILLVCGYLADGTAFNSDNLLSTAQCDDLLHGRDVRDWHLPGAPYLFPDLVLLLPCQLLAPTLPIAFLAYCLSLHLLLAATLAWLASHGTLLADRNCRRRMRVHTARGHVSQQGHG